MVAPAVDLKLVISELVRQLEPNVAVERVILFGSFAAGKAEKSSDIDVAVISPQFTGVPLWRRQEILAEYLRDLDVRVSPIGYAPDELLKPTPFLREIIRTGRVVYAKQ